MNRIRPHTVQAVRFVILAIGLWVAWQAGGANLLTALQGAIPDDETVSYAMPAPGAPALTPAPLEREPLVVTETDPFKPVNFSPPVPPPLEAKPAAALPPPKPVLPPLPYRYFGTMTGVDGKPVTYLARDNEIIAVREKQMLDNVYLVEAVGETAIVLNYLPLNEKIEMLAKQQGGQ